MFLVYKHWRHISFWYSNLPTTESWIAWIVSTANKPLVGTLMTIGDVTRNIAIGQFQAAPSKENNCYKVGKSVKSQEIWIKCILIFPASRKLQGNKRNNSRIHHWLHCLDELEGGWDLLFRGIPGHFCLSLPSPPPPPPNPLPIHQDKVVNGEFCYCSESLL